MTVIADETVTALEIQRAENLISGVLRRHRDAGDTCLRLSAAGPTSMVAQVNLMRHRVPIRAQSDGPGGFALRFVADRLDRQLLRIAAEMPRWEADPGRRPLAYVTEERPIVRRKVFAPQVCTVSDAVDTMAALDFDVHLFVDAESGEDAVVYWAGPLGVRMARQRRVRPPLHAERLPLTMNPHRTRIITEGDAALRLCGYGLPFLFFTDRADGRGRLLYRRYDGDLGLVQLEPGGTISGTAWGSTRAPQRSRFS